MKTTVNTYIKVYRRALDAGWLKNPFLWTFFSYCLLKASYVERCVWHGTQKVHLCPGQFIFGRKAATKEIGLSERQIRTCMAKLVEAKTIAVKSTSKYSVVTVINWEHYQGTVDESDQQATSKRPASDQQVTTNNKVIKKERKKEDIINTKNKSENDLKREKTKQVACEVIDYLSSKLKLPRGLSHSDANLKPIVARLSEGFTPEDCKKVIDKKYSQWKNTEWEKYLRIVTLFRASKFESYFQEPMPTKKIDRENWGEYYASAVDDTETIKGRFGDTHGGKDDE
jgi:uncharacterized phage protein (TIGR02220 family)